MRNDGEPDQSPIADSKKWDESTSEMKLDSALFNACKMKALQIDPVVKVAQA